MQTPRPDSDGVSAMYFLIKAARGGITVQYTLTQDNTVCNMITWQLRSTAPPSLPPQKQVDVVCDHTERMFSRGPLHQITDEP